MIMPDICMFRESEETLKMALEVQKVLWTVINNSPAVVFLWRNEDKWPADFVTENVSQLGYSAEDFTSGKILYGDIIHREDIDRVRAELEYQTKTVMRPSGPSTGYTQKTGHCAGLMRGLSFRGIKLEKSPIFRV